MLTNIIKQINWQSNLEYNLMLSVSVMASISQGRFIIDTEQGFFN